MTQQPRGRLPTTESSSAVGAPSEEPTLSRCGSDVDFGDNFSRTGGGVATQNFDATRFGTGMASLSGAMDIKDFVSQIEDMQARQRSPQQPNPELDAILHRAVTHHGPEWRQKLAVLTKSALLRKKILSILPPGGRGLGCSQYGGNGHSWRRDHDHISDHTWPKAVTSATGLHHLPGGSASHDNLLRLPSDKIRMDPLIRHSECYSLSKAHRFPGCNHDGTLNHAEAQKRGNPGPGAYSKSVPRGTAFSVDGGETQILGANHVCPWKKALGRQINPVDCDLVGQSQPAFSFSKTRRTVSDTRHGHGCQEGGPVKSDQGALSPGHVYEHFGSMRPLPGTMTHGQRSKTLKMARSASATIPRVRSYMAILEDTDTV